MPRKKKTETTDSVETPKTEVKNTRYGAVALQENAKLKKPVLRGSLKQISRSVNIVLSYLAAGFLDLPAAFLLQNNYLLKLGVDKIFILGVKSCQGQ